jgi:hypothetical protein
MSKLSWESADWLTTDCQVCDWKRAQRDKAEGNMYMAMSSRMIVCPECGSKRCPKATFHGLECTGSNEAGQQGSSYGEISGSESDDPDFQAWHAFQVKLWEDLAPLREEIRKRMKTDEGL